MVQTRSGQDYLWGNRTLRSTKKKSFSVQSTTGKARMPSIGNAIAATIDDGFGRITFNDMDVFKKELTKKIFVDLMHTMETQIQASMRLFTQNQLNWNLIDARKNQDDVRQRVKRTIPAIDQLKHNSGGPQGLVTYTTLLLRQFVVDEYTGRLLKDIITATGTNGKVDSTSNWFVPKYEKAWMFLNDTLSIDNTKACIKVTCQIVLQFLHPQEALVDTISKMDPWSRLNDKKCTIRAYCIAVNVGRNMLMIYKEYGMRIAAQTLIRYIRKNYIASWMIEYGLTEYCADPGEDEIMNNSVATRLMFFLVEVLIRSSTLLINWPNPKKIQPITKAGCTNKVYLQNTTLEDFDAEFQLNVDQAKVEKNSVNKNKFPISFTLFGLVEYLITMPYNNEIHADFFHEGMTLLENKTTRTIHAKPLYHLTKCIPNVYGEEHQHDAVPINEQPDNDGLASVLKPASLEGDKTGSNPDGSSDSDSHYIAIDGDNDNENYSSQKRTSSVLKFNTRRSVSPYHELCDNFEFDRKPAARSSPKGMLKRPVSFIEPIAFRDLQSRHTTLSSNSGVTTNWRPLPDLTFASAIHEGTRELNDNRVMSSIRGKITTPDNTKQPSTFCLQL